ncbi:MAG: 2-phospho-L-lactate transferase [Candidatus Nitrosocaldaceae archaeon]|nr:MAG: 2-phospho-L-lactate transferase [Candidatus Nitrosocaldaceae archaeon]GIU71781.1 MAG: 2-phospho-L-lactate transferase [Candidatus Nitrosocaldaceae archaeon]
MLTILAGGTGSVKLVRGFKKDEISIVCNVGDNIWLYGLYICPDIDTIVYGLANLLDRERGWGIKDDTFNFITQLKSLGLDPWFKIGDKDLAIHVLRTKMLKEGNRLYYITKFFSNKFGIKADIIPASEDDIETLILTDQGLIHLQEFWVKHKGMLNVKDIIYKGMNNAKATTRVLDLIEDSDAIIIAPANPISSINPIISIREINYELKKHKDKCIAISPIIGEDVFSGPAAKYMQALGYEISPYGIAKFYSPYISKLVIDDSDKRYIDAIENDFGIKVYTTDIMMRDEEDEDRLAEFIKSVI